MKVISVISKHQGNGQTTVTVNLASGLARQGYQVLIADLGTGNKLCNWLTSQNPNRINIDNQVFTSPLGMDLFKIEPGTSQKIEECLTDLEKYDYGYLLLQPASEEECRLANNIADVTITLTDLSHDNELKELQTLEYYLQNLPGKANGIDLILPNKINTKEWEHNSQRLFALAEYFGYERIADPIPH